MAKAKKDPDQVTEPAEEVAEATGDQTEANAEAVAEDEALLGEIGTVAEPSGAAYEGAHDGLLLRLEEACHYARAFDYPLDQTARDLIAELAAHG